MTVSTECERKENKKLLRKELAGLWIGLLIAIFALAAATFAWYIYNTQAHTTKVKMAAGTSTRLEISNEYDGVYSSAIDLDSFKGTLIPVSTDKITNGFQTALQFINGDEGRDYPLAHIFGKASDKYYFQTTIFIRTNARSQDIYIADLTYDDSDKSNLLASAMRVGFVVHEPGENMPVESEYIFELSKETNPDGVYNTEKGKPGHVLDSTKTDGSTVDFSSQLKTSDNYVEYDPNTGKVTAKPNSLPLFDVSGIGSDKIGTPVQVDVYLWVEGCDSDCTASIVQHSLKNFAVSFASMDKK